MTGVVFSFLFFCHYRALTHFSVWPVTNDLVPALLQILFGTIGLKRVVCFNVRNVVHLESLTDSTRHSSQGYHCV